LLIYLIGFRLLDIVRFVKKALVGVEAPKTPRRWGVAWEGGHIPSPENF